MLNSVANINISDVSGTVFTVQGCADLATSTININVNLTQAGSYVKELVHSQSNCVTGFGNVVISSENPCFTAANVQQQTYVKSFSDPHKM